ncbi:component of the polarisome [Tulasnella sp. 419]|nr:component of the polarisome [Tulasnella sp. 419]
MSVEQCMDERLALRICYDELRQFLASMPPPAGARAAARQKLSHLVQFAELTTDVCDDVVRRTTNTHKNEVLHLSQKEGIEPKRNKARQMMANIPLLWMRDLSSDIVYELGRRYPEFTEA